MARRKVTMLEAFQRSARESAERAAAERRRVIAEREKEIRRAEAAKAAQELGHRLSQRANDSMGTLLAGIRGAGPDETFEAEGDGSAADVPATDINRIAPAEGRRGPALPAFDRASHADLTEVAPSSRAGSMPSEPQAESVLDEEIPEAEPDEIQAETPFADASQEEVEHAIASLEDDVLELPMSPRTFLLVGAALVAVTFMLGYSMGQRSDPVAPGSGYSRAGLEPGAPAARGAGRARVNSAAEAGIPNGGRGARDGSGLPGGGSAAPGAAIPGIVASGSEASKAPLSTVPEMTVEDRLFRRPDMKFSILAITYTRTEAHARMAQETYEYLYGDGFPAIHPIELDSRIYLFVGAAETMGELEDMKSLLHELRSGQSGAQEFRSAYLVNIDPYR